MSEIDINPYGGNSRPQEGNSAAVMAATDSLNSHELNKMNTIIEEHYQKKPTMLGCQAGTLTMILSEEGDVRPCEILDVVLGNIRNTNYSLEPIWRGELANQHRKDIAESCFCTFETCVRTTMVFQPKWILKTLKRGVYQLR